MFITIDDGKRQILTNVGDISKVMTRGKSAVITFHNDGTNEHFSFDSEEEAYNFVSTIHKKLKLLNLA